MSDYISFKSITDENKVLKNPHKGWYFHFIDNGFVRPTYRDEENLEEKLKDFPGLNHLYLRFDWGDIEKTEGVFDWSYIDEIMDTYRKYGFRFSLRFCTYETNGVTPYAIPEWLVPSIEGTDVSLNGKKLFEPKYDNPVFLEKLDAFLAGCAEKFDGNPDIEYIDIGTFGTWGEGHTFCGSGKKFPYSTLKAHVDLHLRHFKNTQLIINDDIITHVSTTSVEDSERLTEYCAGKLIGIRDDGICVDYYCKTYGYDTLRSPKLFSRFTDNAPCDIELEHYARIPSEHFKVGLPFIEALRNTNATYAGFHGHVEPWISDNRYLTEYLANRLGYWYIIDGIRLSTPVSGTKSKADVTVVNKGFSAAYHRYDLKFYVENEQGRYLITSESPDNREWKAETENTAAFVFDFREVPFGKYKLICKMEYNGSPIALGFKDSVLRPDGSYELCDIDVREI